MAKASGSIDLKSLKAAGEVASKYITTIDSNNGIQVHAQNNTAENYVQINSDGMEVFKDNDSKAFFGEAVRIGRENQASITIDDSSIIGYGENGKEFFTFGNSTAAVSTKKTFMVLRLSDASDVPAPNNSLSPLTATLYDTPNSNTFHVYFRVFVGSSTITPVPFKKGTSGTKTATVEILGNSYQFNVSYDGDKYFSDIKALTSIPNTYKVEIYITYSSDTIAPSYELGVNLSTTGGYSYAEGHSNTASGNYSHAEGYSTNAIGNYSHTEGRGNGAGGDYSHAEGYSTNAIGDCSHAEGYDTDAGGSYSHAEGWKTTTTNTYSHAEGHNTTASGEGAHAEGFSSQKYSNYPNISTNAIGLGSHAEGGDSIAAGDYSHSQNQSTIAAKKAQTTLGTYNIEDTSSTTTHPSGTTDYGQYAVIIGNGADINNRSNALTVDWSGNIETSGDVTDGSGNVLSDMAEVKTPSVSVSAATGTLVSATAYQYGKVIQLSIVFRNTASVASGANVFAGTLNTTELMPLMSTSGGSYFGTHAMMGFIGSTGSITIRNASSTAVQITSSSTATVTFTYIVA